MTTTSSVRPTLETNSVNMSPKLIRMSSAVKSFALRPKEKSRALRPKQMSRPPPPVEEEEEASCPPAEEEEEASCPPAEKNHPPLPPVTMHRVVTKCSCGETISHNSAFPQNKQNEWGTKTALRCKKCWESHVNDDLIPQIAQDGAREKKRDS